jgi:hypothetical protein
MAMRTRKRTRSMFEAVGRTRTAKTKLERNQGEKSRWSEQKTRPPTICPPKALVAC